MLAFDLQKINKPRITSYRFSLKSLSLKRKRKDEQKIIIFRLIICRSDLLSERAKKDSNSSLELQGRNIQGRREC